MNIFALEFTARTKSRIFAMAIAAVAAGLVASTAMAEGPRASGGNHIPPSAPVTIPAGQFSASAQGPRASSQDYISPTRTPYTAPTTAPHYVWQGGYVHGKWRGRWVLVQ